MGYQFGANDLEDKRTRSLGSIRYILATVVGVFTGAYLIQAVESGIAFNYLEENPRETWGMLFWGEHWLIRLFWGLMASSVGAYVSGIVARKRGALVGALSVLPSSLSWLAAVAFWLFAGMQIGEVRYESLSLSSKLLSIVLPIASMACGYTCGRLGEESALRLAAHFDKRPNTFIGIRWYHHLWIPIALWPVAMSSAWAVDYGLAWVRVQFESDNFGIMGIISGLFLIGTVSTLVLTWKGVCRAYDFLSDQTRVYSRRESVVGVLKYGVGYALLATVLQSFISLAGWGLAKLAK